MVGQNPPRLNEFAFLSEPHMHQLASLKLEYMSLDLIFPVKLTGLADIWRNVLLTFQISVPIKIP